LSSFFETCSSSLESKYMLLATSNILFRKWLSCSS
jgi:hypothetical protein